MEPKPASARIVRHRILPRLAALVLLAASPATSASRAQAPSHAPPSEAEKLAYANSLLAAFQAKDRRAFDALIDWRSLFDSATAELKLADENRKEMSARMERRMRGEHGFADQIIKRGENEGSLHFLRARRREGKQVLLFRVLCPLEDGTFTYLEFFPRRFPDGKVRAADIYIYSDGEFMAESIRRLMLPVIAERSKNFFEKLVSGDQDYVNDFPKIGRAGQLMSEGKAAEALPIFRSMRPGTLKNKMVLRFRLQAAEAADDKEFLTVFDEFQKLFPDDPCVELFSINFYLLRQDFPAALKVLDRLDRSIGGDPYLDVMRARIHDLQNDPRAAVMCARRAIESEPTLGEAYLTLLGLVLKQEKYDEALALLKELGEKFEEPFDDLDQQEEFAGFIKSPQYAKWLAYRKSLAKRVPPKPALPAPDRLPPR